MVCYSGKRKLTPTVLWQIKYKTPVFVIGSQSCVRGNKDIEGKKTTTEGQGTILDVEN